MDDLQRSIEMDRETRTEADVDVVMKDVGIDPAESKEESPEIPNMGVPSGSVSPSGSTTVSDAAAVPVLAGAATILITASDVKGHKKSSKFLPPRRSRIAEPFRIDEYDELIVSVPKLADAEQDVSHAKNKNFVFKIDALKHKETGKLWLSCKGILLSLGYSTHRGIQNAARAAYFDALVYWLHESGLEHPMEDFYFKLGSQNWISHKGFSLMVPILYTYEGKNNMVSHVVRNRFQYLKLFYGVELVTEPGPYADDPHNHICNLCCLEDLEVNFQQICDCNVWTHMRCPEHPAVNPVPKTDAERAHYFCCGCLSYLARDELIARRARCLEGEYELEEVLGYNNFEGAGYSGDRFPEGAYFVKWKNYPLHASEFIELDASFLEAVHEFWAKQKGQSRSGGQVFENKAKKHLQFITSGSKPKPPKKRGQKLRRGQKRRRAASDDESESVVGVCATAIGSKNTRALKRRRLDSSPPQNVVVPDTNFNNNYIPAKLHLVMDPANIIRIQRFTTTGLVVQNQKESAYVEKLKSRKNRRLNKLMRDHYRNRVPKMFLENDVKEWESHLPENSSQILELLGRDWENEWQNDTSQLSFEIGEIIDPENPAKKYSDKSIEAGVFGLFAKEVIPPGRVLMEYVGVVSTAHEAETPLDHVLHELDQTTLMELKGPPMLNGRSYWGPVANNLMVIDPHKLHNEAVYMNDFRDNVEDDPDDEEDSSDSNERKERATDDSSFKRKKNVTLVEVNVNGWPHVFAISTMLIQPGQELLTDYGSSYWDNFRQITRRQGQIAEIRASDKVKFQRQWDDAKNGYETKVDTLRGALIELANVVRDTCPGVEISDAVKTLLIVDDVDVDVEMKDVSASTDSTGNDGDDERSADVVGVTE